MQADLWNTLVITQMALVGMLLFATVTTAMIISISIGDGQDITMAIFPWTI